MEVHHHSGHSHKKFKDFVKEFFMIFLAVMLGFLAENFRERLTDRSHVSALIRQLREDLIADTNSIRRLIDDQEIQIRRTDSLFDALTRTTVEPRNIQQLLINCDHIELFYPSTGASTTIRTELHLKEFVETRISQHITSYDRDVALLQAFENRDMDYMGKYLETFMSKHFTPANARAGVDRLALTDDHLRNLAPGDLDQMAVDINLIKAYNRQLVIRYHAILKDAKAFIQFIDRTY